MRLLINARNRSVGIEAGRIVAPAGGFDIVLDVPDADIRPGLINAHDHLHRNHYGRLGDPPYPNAYRWAEDIQRRYRRRIADRRAPRRSALLAGAWKNLFAGVTTVVHHDRWEPDFERDFPVRVARAASADSLGMERDLQLPDIDGPFCLHVAEGTDPEAANEVRELNERGMLTSRLVAVHAVGLDEGGIDLFRRSGAAMVWCPTSNNFLFGTTAPNALLNSGCDVLLGSDSRLTGEGDLLDELRFARAHGGLNDERLQDAVGGTAARRFGLPDPSLEFGAAADLILVEKPLLEARAEDVALVIVDGAVRVARPDLVPALNGVAERGQAVTIGSVTRWTSIDAAQGREGATT